MSQRIKVNFLNRTSFPFRFLFKHDINQFLITFLPENMFIEQIIICMLILPILLIYGQRQDSATNQTICYEVVNSPDQSPLWSQAGLDMNVDWIIRCGDIIAYKILWSNAGDWSDWYVTGLNDLLPSNDNNQKRMWSLFSQHYHIFIICKSNKIKFGGTNC
jgi:hypothetical protein